MQLILKLRIRKEMQRLNQPIADRIKHSSYFSCEFVEYSSNFIFSSSIRIPQVVKQLQQINNTSEVQTSTEVQLNDFLIRWHVKYVYVVRWTAHRQESKSNFQIWKTHNQINPAGTLETFGNALTSNSIIRLDSNSKPRNVISIDQKIRRNLNSMSFIELNMKWK